VAANEVSARALPNSSALNVTPEGGEIALEYTVNKNRKRNSSTTGAIATAKNDDHHSLLDRARSAKKLDDVLLARIRPKNAAKIASTTRSTDNKKQQNHSRAQCLDKT